MSNWRKVVRMDVTGIGCWQKISQPSRLSWCRIVCEDAVPLWLPNFAWLKGPMSGPLISGSRRSVSCCSGLCNTYLQWWVCKGIWKEKQILSPLLSSSYREVLWITSRQLNIAVCEEGCRRESKGTCRGLGEPFQMTWPLRRGEMRIWCLDMGRESCCEAGSGLPIEQWWRSGLHKYLRRRGWWWKVYSCMYVWAIGTATEE
jgi:hypothetical protein